MAMQRPARVTAIVSQNGNAYEEGLGDAWQPIQRYWREPTLEHRNAIGAGLNLEGLRREYSVGIPDPALIKPEGYTLDAALLARPGNVDIQLDLFLDYANNVKLYPKFQDYFRSAQPPLLAIWGKFDPYFIPPGAEAFLRDNPRATVQFLETGHFALETHLEEVASAMREFLQKGSAKIRKTEIVQWKRTSLTGSASVSTHLDRLGEPGENGAGGKPVTCLDFLGGETGTDGHFSDYGRDLRVAIG